jgi:hypothetical protein
VRYLKFEVHLQRALALTAFKSLTLYLGCLVAKLRPQLLWMGKD